MCLLPVLHLLLKFMNALRLFPRLSLCPMILHHNRLLLFHFLRFPCSHHYRRRRRLHLLLVCLLPRILRFLCILRRLLKVPLSSLQTPHSSRSPNRSSSHLSLPPTLFRFLPLHQALLLAGPLYLICNLPLKFLHNLLLLSHMKPWQLWKFLKLVLLFRLLRLRILFVLLLQVWSSSVNLLGWTLLMVLLHVSLLQSPLPVSSGRKTNNPYAS